MLIPGAGGAGWYWHRVVPELRRRGQDAIVVDLPGEDESAGLDAYVDLVVSAADGHEPLVLVGQSLGGFTASAACAQLPVELLILVNAMIPQPGESAGQWWGATGQAEAKAASDTSAVRPIGFDLERDFLHDVPPEIAAAGLPHQRAEADAVFGSVWPLAQWPDVPTRVIAGQDDRFFPVDFQRRVARERLGIEPVVVPGGHLIALSRPVELVEQLETFRTEL